MTRLVHAITPGDHYSPRTGSAIPTVVHGLAGAAAADRVHPSYEQFVALQAGTYQPRYDSAEAIEFTGVSAPDRNERLLDAGLGVFGRPRRAAARYFQPLADALSSLPASVVLAHNAPILPWLLRDSKHDVVLYAHNDILRSMTAYESARALDSVRAIVCVSESLAGQLRPHLPRALRERIRVVVNGVDTVQFSPGSPRVAARRRVRVMFVGRMIEQKGPDVLLRAAALLGRDDIEVELVGSAGFDSAASLTPYERRLRELAAQCSVPVTFRPFVARPELPELLRSADIVIIPSRWQDPCPLTVGEALASGAAVIAHRVGGIPEIVGTAAILVDNDAPAELAAAIGRLADDPQQRSDFSAAARAQAESHDWSWAWSHLRAVLDDVTRVTA